MKIYGNVEAQDIPSLTKLGFPRLLWPYVLLRSTPRYSSLQQLENYYVVCCLEGWQTTSIEPVLKGVTALITSEDILSSQVMVGESVIQQLKHNINP